MKLKIGRDWEIMKKAVADLGQEQALQFMRAAVDSGKMKPEEFSLVDLYESLDTTAFPKATAALIHAKVIQGYDSVSGIGDNLVTVVPSNKKQETIVGFNASEGMLQVGEGMPYEDSTLSEKYVTITNRKWGRLISITEETIKFDQTNQILARARGIGRKAAIYREKEIMEAVIDANTTSYYPSGSAAAFYSGGNNNLATSNAFNSEGLQVMKTMIDDMTDSEGDPIFIDTGSMILLVPSELEVEAWEIQNAIKVPETFENAPNYFKGRYAIMSSPYLTSATDWWLGDFKEDFWWTEVYPIQILQKKSDEDEFNRDVISVLKVRYFGRAAAIDTAHSFESNA